MKNLSNVYFDDWTSIAESELILKPLLFPFWEDFTVVIDTGSSGSILWRIDDDEVNESFDGVPWCLSSVIRERVFRWSFSKKIFIDDEWWFSDVNETSANSDDDWR